MSPICSSRRSPHHHVLHEGGRIDFEDVEEFTIDRFDVYDVAEAAYDPRYLERSAELLEARLAGGLIFPVEPASRHMRDALQTFYRLVTEGTLRHRGDPVLAAHLANCAEERGHADEIRRVRKLDERRPIDALIPLLVSNRDHAKRPCPSGIVSPALHVTPGALRNMGGSAGVPSSSSSLKMNPSAIGLLPSPAGTRAARTSVARWSCE